MNPKTFILLLLALALSAGGLFATQSRMTALGYPYGIIRDDSDVHAYPGTIFKYNRGIYGELYSDGAYWDWSLGANVPLKTNVFGLYLNLPSGVDADYHLDGYSDIDLYKKVQAYYGFADKFALGLAFGFDSAKGDYESSGSKASYIEKQQGQFVELSAGMSDTKMDLGLKILYQGAGINEKYDNTSTDLASYSGFSFDLGGRYFIQQNEKLELAIFADAGIEILNDELGEIPVKATRKYAHTNMMADLGIGANYELAPGHNIILSLKPLGLYSAALKGTTVPSSSTYYDTQTVLILPEYTLGVESRITRWLTGRVGAKQSNGFWTWKEELESGSETIYHDTWTQYDSGFDMNVGLAFKLGKFTIDTVLSKDLLHAGPDFLGGMATGLASHVSVKFEY